MTNSRSTRKFQIGDVVYWLNPPKESMYPLLEGVAGKIIARRDYVWDVKFPKNDIRSGFFEYELISAELYNSPLYKALR